MVFTLARKTLTVEIVAPFCQQICSLVVLYFCAHFRGAACEASTASIERLHYTLRHMYGDLRPAPRRLERWGSCTTFGTASQPELVFIALCSRFCEGRRWLKVFPVQTFPEGICFCHAPGRAHFLASLWAGPGGGKLVRVFSRSLSTRRSTLHNARSSGLNPPATCVASKLPITRVPPPPYQKNAKAKGE